MAARTLLVVGARNLGSAIAERFGIAGWNVAGVARSEETAEQVRELVPGSLGFALDASDPDALADAVRQTREHFGSLDAMVNAASPGARSRGVWGGGPLTEATMEDFDHYATQVSRMVFSFLSTGARALRESGGGTLVQVTGGSSRRAIPGRGPWAAGAFATRALSQSAALELREDGIHAALLIVDATIASPKTEDLIDGQPPDNSTTMDDVAAAVEYLVGQDRRGWTHELTITARGDNWTP